MAKVMDLVTLENLCPALDLDRGGKTMEGAVEVAQEEEPWVEVLPTAEVVPVP